eukprot:COSAG02_NODE_893_length_16140_cov_19.677621_11_plen_62_part_00
MVSPAPREPLAPSESVRAVFGLLDECEIDANRSFECEIDAFSEEGGRNKTVWLKAVGGQQT